MKKAILLIVTSLILIGCASSKPHCDAYGDVKTEQNDSTKSV